MAPALQRSPTMLRESSVAVGWGELLVRTAREFVADNCFGLAAQLAYYLLLGLVPALVALISLASFFPPGLVQQLVDSLSSVAPTEIADILRDQIEAIAGSGRSGLLTLGFLAALWSSSSALVALTDALNRAYDIEEARPWWRVRLVGLALTLVLALFILLALALVLVGPTAAEWLARLTGLGAALEWTWKILQWPLAFALVAFALALVNYFGPDAEQDWTWISPGAILATALWLIVSLGFKFYLSQFADYNATYGSLGGVIVLLLWLYLSGAAILAGAELNAEIEHASPWGKARGEKTPGEKRKLGARARRAWRPPSGAT